METAVGDEVELAESMPSFKAMCSVLDCREGGVRRAQLVAAAPSLKRLRRFDFQRDRVSSLVSLCVQRLSRLLSARSYVLARCATRAATESLETRSPR